MEIKNKKHYDKKIDRYFEAIEVRHGEITGKNLVHKAIKDIFDELYSSKQDEIEKLKLELQDWRDTQKSVMSETCPSDEKHCTCVPMLKKEINTKDDKLTKAINVLTKIRDWNSHTIEFAADNGSNGVRDVYRGLAEDFLTTHHKK